MDNPAIHAIPATTPTRQRQRWLWLYYACAIACIGLLQGTAELQHYWRDGGRHAWEPYLWELSSVGVTAALAPQIYRWHVAGLAHQRSLLWRHPLGALVYMLVHVGGMFGIRFAVYALAGVPYHAGSAATVLAYEAGKDLVGYFFITLVCHGIYLFLAAQRRERDLQRVRGELAEARLARLSEQLQPHFLFNSLNLIGAVMYEDVARADTLLCDLATLLRQTLAAQQLPRHTLAQELTLIAPYLALMQARFGTRLAFSVAASDAARRCGVPTLLLISPIENAIKHDVAVSATAVNVRIHAWCGGGDLHVAVDNSGMAPQRTERAGAFGLDNVRQRLHALHGARAQVTLAPHPDGGTRLLIRLPAEVLPDSAAADDELLCPGAAAR